MTQQFRTQSTLTTFGFGARSSLHDVVLKRCRAALGRVVRVDRVPVAMLQRMLVALFGLTSWSEDVLHEEIMVVVQRRRFAAYDVERGCLFETREKWMGCT